MVDITAPSLFTGSAPKELLNRVTHGDNLDVMAKPIPRWDVHFGISKMTERTPRHLLITFELQLGGHRRCGLGICTFHLGFSLGCPTSPSA